MRKRNAKRYLQAEEIFVPQSSVEGEPSDVNLCSQNLSDCEKVTTGNVLLSGRIHSVFHHVINVVTEQGTLFSLVNQGTETFAGAISLVEDIDLKTLLLKAGDPVVWQTDMICLGSLVHISLDHVQVQTVPYVPEIGQDISRQTISRISHLVEIYGNKSSLYDALFDQPYLDEYGRMFRERLHRLQAAPGRLWKIEKPAPVKWLQRLRRLAQIKWYRQIRMLVQVRGVLIMIIKARSGKQYPAFWGLESV